MTAYTTHLCLVSAQATPNLILPKQLMAADQMAVFAGDDLRTSKGH